MWPHRSAPSRYPDTYPYSHNNSAYGHPAYTPAFAHQQNAPGWSSVGQSQCSGDQFVDDINARLDALEQTRPAGSQSDKKPADHAIDADQVVLLTQLFGLFEVYDVDGNGCIDKDEYWKVSNQLRIKVEDQDWTREMSDAQLEEMDADGDGMIQPSEYYAYCRKKLCVNYATFLEALKQHQDVTMDPDELSGGDILGSLSEQQKATMMLRTFQMFEMYDTDGNGLIDKDEYWAISSQIRNSSAWTRQMSDQEVDSMDKNGDGVISPEEFFTHCKKNMNLTKSSFEAAVDLYQDCTMSKGELASESSEAFWK